MPVHIHATLSRNKQIFQHLKGTTASAADNIILLSQCRFWTAATAASF